MSLWLGKSHEPPMKNRGRSCNYRGWKAAPTDINFAGVVEFWSDGVVEWWNIADSEIQIAAACPQRSRLRGGRGKPLPQEIKFGEKLDEFKSN